MRFPILSSLLLASVAMAQAASDAPTTGASVHPAQSSSAANPARLGTSKSSTIGPNTPVITIHGLCEAAKSEAQVRTGSTKSRKTTICRTVITRSEFDALADALQPNMDLATKRQLAVMYPKLLLMQREFRGLGLEKDPNVKRALDFAKLRAEGDEVAKTLQEQAQIISDGDIEQYFKSNGYFFDTAELLRIYVPKEKHQASAGGTADSDPDTMKKEADAIQARASAGEDFSKLQNDAYAAAGISGARPPVNMGKVTANELPPSQRGAMNLKPGEVSQVIVDNGYYIFKVVSKDQKPLPQVRTEITNILAQQRFTKLMQQVDQSGRTDLNEDYFPPSAASGPVSPASFGIGRRGFGTPGFRNPGSGSRFNRSNSRFAVPTVMQQPGAASSDPH